jgi:adenylate cyclase
VEPSPDEIRAGLERVLASPGFANAGRMAAFLRYVVERTLAGESEQIKEYAIGVDVFGRDASYDPRLDSIVRVEARRLRSKLDEYYNGPGRDDEVVIRLQRGGYAPTFERRIASPVEPAVEVPPIAASAAAARRPASRIALALALVVVAMAAFAWRGGYLAQSEPRASASIAVLPFSHYSADERDALLAKRLTDGVTSELARLRTLRVVSHSTVLQFLEARPPVTDLGKALNADVLVEGRATRADGTVDVSIRLISGQTNFKLWVENFSGKTDDLAELERRIAARVSAEAIPAATRK